MAWTLAKILPALAACLYTPHPFQRNRRLERTNEGSKEEGKGHKKI